MSEVVLALDCGTHAVRTLLFDTRSGQSWECAVEPLQLLFPRPGWVEIDPEELAAAAGRVVREAVEWASREGHDILAMGIANMRETAFAWSRASGAPAYPGIMWMSQQSQPTVDRWRTLGLDPLIRSRTGLANDAFFFGSKVAWLLEHDRDCARMLDEGDLAVGSVDSWLVYCLTGGREHRTDTSNGSRTQLMSLRDLRWDEQMCATLGVPASCLPELTPSMAVYGTTDASVCGAELPITGVIADQQASLLGHGCEQEGDLKVTFGTSGVVCLNQGPDASLHEGMVTSVAWSDGAGRVAYEAEGSAFHCGYTVSWLADRLGESVSENLTEAQQEAPERVYVLPSFTALGAPRWPRGRGAAIVGLAMDTTGPEILRAGVEAMAFQAYDLMAALGDAAFEAVEVNVDGGGARNDYLCQLLADLSERDVVRPGTLELTSVGAAKAALRGAGGAADRYFGQDRADAVRFRPRPRHGYARAGYARWTELVETVLR